MKRPLIAPGAKRQLMAKVVTRPLMALIAAGLLFGCTEQGGQGSGPQGYPSKLVMLTSETLTDEQMTRVTNWYKTSVENGSTFYGALAAHVPTNGEYWASIASVNSLERAREIAMGLCTRNAKGAAGCELVAGIAPADGVDPGTPPLGGKAIAVFDKNLKVTKPRKLYAAMALYGDYDRNVSGRDTQEEADAAALARCNEKYAEFKSEQGEQWAAYGKEWKEAGISLSSFGCRVVRRAAP
ncbi:MAG: hypothetical protein CML68_08420 [Rhodobacteraceae bacterium]|nr:hypothetical protein [Paracoccaceae bacterium]